jgi:hypothetical protein
MERERFAQYVMDCRSEGIRYTGRKIRRKEEDELHNFVVYTKYY